MKEISTDWLVGFIEGEGCFTTSRPPSGKIIPKFTLSQNELDILQKLKSRFKIGHIHYSKPHNNSKESWCWQVQSFNECWALYKLVKDKFHTSLKEKSFKVWEKFLFDYKLDKRRWSEREDKLLVEMIKDGYDYTQIAKALDRSICAIQARNWTKFNSPIQTIRKRRQK